MDIKGLVDRFHIKVVDGDIIKARFLSDADEKKYLAEIKEKKQEIIDYIKQENERKAEKKAKIEAIEGLAELDAVSEEWEIYHEKYNAAFETEDCIFPAAPATKIEDVAKKYPCAVAYRKARSYFWSEHHIKSEAGRKAMERIENGEDYEIVIKEMVQEFSDYCMKAMFD